MTTSVSATQRVSWPRTLAAGLVPPVVVAAGASAVIAGAAGELPDPVAVHFGVDLKADGFAALDTVRWSPLLGVAVAALLVVIQLAITRRDERTSRVSVTLGAGVGGFVAALAAFIVLPQRGLADAAQASAGFGAMLLAVVVGLAAAGVGYAAMPRPRATEAVAPPPVEAPRIPLGDTEQVSWSGSAAMPWWLAAVAVLVPMVVVLVVAGFSAGSMWLVLGLVALTALLTALLLAPVRVVVDAHGLQARSPVAVRRIRIPLAEVAEAEAVRVGLINGYGGFGYRVGPAGTGLIVRPGAALRVTRGDGSRFTVTVDGADQAAAVLNTLAAQGRVPN